MEKVTVVIPNYNGEKYIGPCLDRLKGSEDVSGFAVTVVDNGSEDRSVSVLREEYPWVRLICLPENTGFCHAVNLGVREAESEYVILLNNDTIVKTGFIKSLISAMDNRKNAFSVSAQMLMWDNPELVDDAGDRYCALGWAFSRGKGKPAACFCEPAEVFSACGGAAIYRRGLFLELGGLDELHFAYLEDLDIGYRARLFGYRNYYEPEAKVLHFGSASSGSRYNPFKARLTSANSVYLIYKNMPVIQWIINFPFFFLGFSIKTLFFIKKGMGILYLKGLYTGFKRCFTPDGRKHKVKFRFRHLRNYLAVQLQLFVNIFRLPVGK